MYKDIDLKGLNETRESEIFVEVNRLSPDPYSL